MQSLVERRITDLHGKLHITSQQSQQWDQFAQVMRDNAREMDQVYKQRAEKLGSMSAVDNMQSYAQIEQQRAQDAQKLVPAFQTLYSSLSDQQKKTADEIFRNYAAQRARTPPGGGALGSRASPSPFTARHWPLPGAGAICRRSRRRSAPAYAELTGSASRSSAMKPGIHPAYHEITIVMTDGTQFKTRSCYGKQGDSLRLDIDPKSHPAWTGQHRIIDSGGQVAKFNRKFAGLGIKK